MERICGMRLADFKCVHFLETLGMDRTHFEDDSTKLVLPTPALDNYLFYQGDVIEFDTDNLSSAR
jgi:hypothetical protein